MSVLNGDREYMAHTSVVVMGVTGSGKSTVGALLAARIGLPFIDGDALHSEANKRKMAAGIPLDDADRAPWLDAIATALAEAPVVVACSALKRSYRDRLRAGALDVQFIYLAGPPTLLAQRLGARSHEFMPPSLLESQLAILEPPGFDENALTIDIRLSPEAIVDCAARWLKKPIPVPG
jgi:carbohydrate kinase (thermoresistant glucokinase family)